MDNSKSNKEEISIKSMFSTLAERKKLFLRVLSVTFALSCLWILPQPRFYKATVMLAPEASGAGTLGSISALASSFGVDLNAGSSTDAIYPELYPDLMTSTDFVVSLFDIPVKTIDGEIECSLYEYLDKHQKVTFYMQPYYKLKKKITDAIESNNAFNAANSNGKGGNNIDPFRLNDRQTQIVEGLKGNVNCMVDKLTNVFSISVTAQDPLVAATLADSIRGRLQNFIIKYRTNKARIDLKHYEALTAKAKTDYDNAVAKYSGFQESHYNVTSKEVIAVGEKLQRDQEIKYNTYNAMNIQLQAAAARLQERTPAFTLLQTASVPIKPAGPKRMIFVFAMMVLATLGTCIYILKSDVTKTIVFFSRN